MKKLIVPLAVLAVFLSGCINDLNLDPDTSFSYQGHWQAPLVNTRLNLGDLVEEDSLATSDPDGLVRIIFRQDSVFSQNVYDYTSVPLQDPQQATFSVGAPPISISTNLGTFGGAKMKSIRAGGGILRWTADIMDSTVTDTIKIALKLLNTTINSIPVEFEVIAAGLGETSGEIDITDLTMDLTQGTPAYNNLGFELGIDTTQTNAPNGTTVDIVLQYDSLQLGEAVGFFGQRQINFPSGNLNTQLSLLDNLSDGLYLANPQVNLFATSNIGLPLAIKADMIGIGRNGNAVDLGLDTLFFQGSSSSSVFSTDTFSISTANSNIDNFIAAIPEEIIYSGGVEINPNGETGIDNFVTNDGTMTVGLEIDLPLELSTTNLTIEQTLYDIDFGVEEDDVDFVEELSIGFRVENGFPLDADLFFYFQDSTGTVLDSNTIQIFDAAQVDGNGNVITPARGDRFLTFSDDQIKNVLKSDDIRIKVVLNTSNGGSQVVRLLTSYYIDLVVGARAKLNYNLNE